MVTAALRRARARLVKLLEAAAALVVVAAAFVFRVRAQLLDVAGAVCLALFVARYVDGGALAVAAVWLMLTAYNLERDGQPRRPLRRRAES